jgi:heme o synthase
MTLPVSATANEPHTAALGNAESHAPAASFEGTGVGSFRDLVALTKPRITTTVLMTTMTGVFMAPETPSAASIAGVAVGTAMVVGGANALNMYLERDSDRLMTRTAKRPLPAGRMSPTVALGVGLALSAFALPVLYVSSNIMTAILAAIANVSYVMVYTPMKQRSWTAVLAGAVPGALPPLLGWTASTGLLGAGGLALFAIMFAWQIPHFHAIALFREAEYTRAGLKVLPAERGPQSTRRSIALWTAALVGLSFTPFALDLTTLHYVPCALVLDLIFLCWALFGVSLPVGPRWAKSYFAVSIPYLVLLFTAMLVFRAG